MAATTQTQWEGAETERAGRQWRRTVCKLVDSAEICTCATSRIGRLSARVCEGRGCWDFGAVACKKLETTCRQELKANIYRGFNLHGEQKASGVGQCVCSRAEEHGGGSVVIRQTVVD